MKLNGRVNKIERLVAQFRQGEPVGEEKRVFHLNVRLNQHRRSWRMSQQVRQTNWKEESGRAACATDDPLLHGPSVVGGKYLCEPADRC